MGGIGKSRTISRVCAVLATMLIAATVSWLEGAPQSASSGKQRLLRLHELEAYQLSDVSADGSLGVFYYTENPITSYRITWNQKGERTVEGPAGTESNQATLRVVDLESGKDVARLPVADLTRYSRFRKGTTEIMSIYTVFEPDGFGGGIEFWNYETGDVRRCDTGYPPRLMDTVVVDAGRAFAKDGFDQLVAINLPECSLQPLGTPVRAGNVTREPLTVSPDASHIAYFVGSLDCRGCREVRIRRTSDADPITKSSVGITDGQPVYTADGQFLVVIQRDGRNGPRTLLFIDADSYELVRKVPFDWKYAFRPVALIAISPRGDVFAYGVGSEDRKRLNIGLFDLQTGKDLAHADHPVDRSVSMSDFIGGLQFAADGKYLLSSAHDTIIWRIEDRED